MLIHIKINEYVMYFDTETAKVYRTPDPNDSSSELMPQVWKWEKHSKENPPEKLGTRVIAFFEALINKDNAKLKKYDVRKTRGYCTEINNFFRSYIAGIDTTLKEEGFADKDCALLYGNGEIKEKCLAAPEKTITSMRSDEDLPLPRIILSKFEETWSWTTINFGRYPQSEIYAGDALYEFLTKTADNEFKNGYCIIDGKKIFRLSKKQVEKAAFYGSGRQEIDWESKEYRYFRVEPLLWRVIYAERKEDDMILFLLSEKGIDCKSYHHTARPVTWDKASLSAWLNAEKWDPEGAVKQVYYTDSFLNMAFSKEELKHLLIRESNDADVLPESKFQSREGYERTVKHYVSLLNKQEAFNRSYGFLPHESDAAFPNQIYLLSVTDYAAACGADHASMIIDGSGFKNLCGWEIRETGDFGTLVSGFFGDGSFVKHGMPVYKSGFEGAVRPVIHVRIPCEKFDSLVSGSVSSIYRY